MEQTDLSRYIRSLAREKYVVLIFTIMGLAASWFLAYRALPPQYQAQTSILVNQQLPSNDGSLQYDTILANQALVDTYSDIIRSNTLAIDVISKLHLKYTPGQLIQRIQVSTPNQSQIIDISVLAPDEAQAVAIANQAARSFQQMAVHLMNLQNVQIVDPALMSKNAAPVKPDKHLDLIAGLLAGLVVGVAVALIWESVDKRIKSEEEVEQYFGLPVLGVIGEQKK